MVGFRRPDYALSEHVGAKKSQFGSWFFNRLINLAGKLSMTMSISLAPPLLGGRGAFTLAAWNIRCGCNAGLPFAAKGLVQMGVGLAILTETKVMDNHHPRLAPGYKSLASKVASHNQGGGLPCYGKRIAGIMRWNWRASQRQISPLSSLSLVTSNFIAWECTFPQLT
jgi:hypothetical protein